MANRELGGVSAQTRRVPSLAPRKRQKVREMELLLRLSREISTIDALDELLQTIVDLCSRETDSERGTLFLTDEETGELYSRVAQGLDIREIRIMKDSGVAGRVFTTGEGMIIEDAYSNPLFDRSIDQETRYVTRNLACAPIHFKGDVIGVLQVLNKKSGAYTKEDLSLLEAMAEHTAITLRSALFRERTKAIREQEMRFLNFVAEVGSDLELGAMLIKIVTEAAQMLKADRATLFLHDDKRRRAVLARRHGGLSGRDSDARPHGHRRSRFHFWANHQSSACLRGSALQSRAGQAHRLFHAIDSLRADRQ